jgi:hypothetical protein
VTAAKVINAEHREPAILKAYEAALAAVLKPLCMPQTQALGEDNRNALAAELEHILKAKNTKRPPLNAGPYVTASRSSGLKHKKTRFWTSGVHVIRNSGSG